MNGYPIAPMNQMFVPPAEQYNGVPQRQFHFNQFQPYWHPMMMTTNSVPALYKSQKRSAAEMEDKVLLRGKWTAEEEAYAAVLIQHFRNGVLPDCEDGTTLRSYLAEKLECIPMRISKKFAGIKIGKEIYRRGRPTAEVAYQLEYNRDLFIQSTSKKRKRIKRKMQKAAAAAKAEKTEEVTELKENPPALDAGLRDDLVDPSELSGNDDAKIENDSSVVDNSSTSFAED